MDIIAPSLTDHAINRNPLYLHPIFFKRIQTLIHECAMKGVNCGLFEGYRSPARQKLLFASGRTIPGPKRTNAEPWQSYHQYGVAADMVVDGDDTEPGYQWNWDDKKGEYDIIGAMAEKCGLEWAGRWKRMKEKPHVQMPLGYRESELREMYDYHKNLTGLFEEMNAGTFERKSNG